MMESPLINLAPKLKRPLSLCNPLDYLLLLYWVFYFPQAIHWYVENYCESRLDLNQLTWQRFWKWLKNSPRKRHLAIMGILLTVTVPILFCFCLDSIGVPIDWSTSGVLFGITIGMLFGIVLSATFGLAIGLEGCVSFGIMSGMTFGLAFGLVFRVIYAISFGLAFRVAFGLAIGSALGITFSIFFGLARGVLFGMESGIEACLTLGIGTIIAILRPDDRYFLPGRIPRTTPLLIPQISHQVSMWLTSDWQIGLMNVNQLLKYSRQFITVDVAINNVLANMPSDILLERIAKLSDLIWELDILRYSSASLIATMKAKFIMGLFWLPNKAWFAICWGASQDCRFDTSYRSAAAGFWHLHEAATSARRLCISNLFTSAQTFERLRHIENGEEMYQLVSILYSFAHVSNMRDLLNLTRSPLPESQLLRPASWSAIKNLTLAVEEAHIINRATSLTTRSFAVNRAIGYTRTVQNNIKSLPSETSRIERPLIQKIAIVWEEIFLSKSREIEIIEINKPIVNPYIIGSPVFGSHFIGREDILRQLEELWFINTNPQSVILYGNRRMGKTSILRNASTKVNSQVKVAYVNLLSVGSAPNGITDILMAICDALEESTEIPTPNNSDLFQFPETTFRRYLQHIEKNFTGTGLIIALDEFEKIEELIDAGKLSKEFLGFLRGMVQMSSKLAFAFAGLHTLQEMNADYFQPFYASFIPISVAFLTREATHQVLANPDPEFLLEYEPAALDHIYDLTNGQPYLTQLIGFQLVRMFNDYVFEQGKPRDRTFTIDDIRTICSGENFFTTGINYFNGVWQQAAEGAAHQQDILKALASHPQGLTESELISQTNLPSETLQAALKTLKDHDVIRSHKTNEIVNWAIAVELFRTWVARYKLSD